MRTWPDPQPRSGWKSGGDWEPDIEKVEVNTLDTRPFSSILLGSQTFTLGSLFCGRERPSFDRGTTP